MSGRAALAPPCLSGARSSGRAPRASRLSCRAVSPAEIPVAALPPEVTTDRLEALEDEAEGYVGPEGLHLIVDLAQTTFICSGGLGMLRSEERRVGKECRSRWS